MHRTLIVARIGPGADQEVARIFAESDTTELPHLVGVRGRSLFRFHDLYFHLIESESPAGPAVEAVRTHPMFRQINTALAAHIAPYDPVTWRSPKDAMATEFYRWSPAPDAASGTERVERAEPR